MTFNKFFILRFAFVTFLWGEIIGINLIPHKNLTVLAQETIRITQINNIPQQSSGIQIYLTGEVTEKVPFLGLSAYALRDETGTIWVFTDQLIPVTGERILIEGEIQYQSIPIEGQEVGEFYVKQVQRLDISQYVLENTVASNPMIETPIIETPIAETPIETVIIEPPKPRKLPFEPEFLPHK